MVGLIYFLKGRPEASDSSGGKAHPYAWAERVCRVPEGLRAENIQVPWCEWQDGRLRMRARPLGDRLFSGMAYRLPKPDWFRPDPAGTLAEPASPNDWERLLHLTPLGRLCREPEVRRALAQDRLAGSLAPLLEIPDLLTHEERLLRSWEAERPEITAEAKAAAARVAAAAGSAPAEARRLLVRLRLAALRRIDAAAVGREIFTPCPAFFGEPYLGCDLPDGLTLKIGIVRMAHAWPRPEMEVRSRAWRGREDLVRAIESRLFPLLPPDDFPIPPDWAASAAAWRELAPLREFEARTPLPLFPCETVYPEGYLPPGYLLRIRPETVRALGGSFLTLAAARLSPYIAEPFHQLCETRSDLLAAWSADLPALAEHKWGGRRAYLYC